MNAIEFDLYEIMDRLERLEKQVEQSQEQAASSIQGALAHFGEVLETVMKQQVSFASEILDLRKDPRSDTAPTYNVSALCRGVGTSWDAYRTGHAVRIAAYIGQGEKIEEHDGDFYTTRMLFWHVQTCVDQALGVRCLQMALDSPCGEQFEARLHDKAAETFGYDIFGTENDELPDEWSDKVNTSGGPKS